jgi:hypothetical protein
MLQTISDKLFMGSLILLMISAIISGIGFQFANWRTSAGEEPGEDVNNGPRKKAAMDKQDRSLKRFFRSYLLWISLLGMAISIVLSYL